MSEPLVNQQVVKDGRTWTIEAVRAGKIFGRVEPGDGGLAYSPFEMVRVDWDNFVESRDVAPSEPEVSVGDRIPAERPRPSDRFVRFFRYDHLPEGSLRDTSALCARLFDDMREKLGEGPELTAGIRKLLEAKDCFVRQALEDRDRG